jgi:FkbM family methyltransferase
MSLELVSAEFRIDNENSTIFRHKIEINLFMNIFKFKKAISRVLGYYKIYLNDTKFKFDPYHIDTWKMISSGTWEPNSYKILSHFLTPSVVFYDLGSWIGPLTVYAAKICKSVVSFEPDPVAYQFLLWNIRLNELGNVIPVNAAISNSDGLIEMTNVGKLGNSLTSQVMICPTRNKINVLSLTLETWMKLSKTEIPKFIKIDIEGGEFKLLPSIKKFLSKYKPILYLSTHTPFLIANQRREEMNRIINILGIYKTCLNEKLEQVNLKDLLNEDILNGFHSFVLLDL